MRIIKLLWYIIKLSLVRILLFIPKIISSIIRVINNTLSFLIKEIEDEVLTDRTYGRDQRESTLTRGEN